MPPVYRLRGFFGSSLLTTSPYLTDTAFAENDSKRLKKYLEASIELCERQKSDYLLIKTRLPEFAEILSAQFVISEEFITTVLDISQGEDFVWKKLLKTKKRNKVRKGYKQKSEVKVGRQELLKDFYRVIAITQRDLGTPVHSIKYFSNIINHHPKARLIVVYISDIPASAALLIINDSTLCHPYSGTVNKYKPTRISNALYWEIIKFGVKNNCHTFDMGRSFKGSGNAQFKKSWGGEEIQLHYCYYLNKKTSLPDYHSKTMILLTGIWSHLPVYFTKKIGSCFIRSIP